MLRPPPRSPLFPYTTLFRSLHITGLADGLTGGGQVFFLDLAGARGVLYDGPVSVTLDVPAFRVPARFAGQERSEEHTSELQSQFHLVCRLLLEKKKKNTGES